MVSKTIKRLPETKTLYDILPKGTEGGKEFARLVDLLLFHSARREGKKVSIFSDASGDYHGLDSFEGDIFRKHGTIGYQYKFFSSPLSDEHRRVIKKSLMKAAEDQKDLKLTKWILVTPQDLTESATRRENGDVSWFENLRKELRIKFEIEHWGHRKLQGMFLETPSLCLYYYPELVPEGSLRRTSIQAIHKLYNVNFMELHRRIEFVGMSVYKPEATRGVPMEHIYIPLTAIPDTVSLGDADAARLNPLSFLASGSRNVVLGDPGSGKSTLLRFLALAGLSKAIQQRYKARANNRLPILVILRRYAEELKGRRNLSLLDYIQETVQADFSLRNADFDFLEYFLESGQTLILFDGLDELPNPEFKQLVRDRIRSLLTTYPENTAIVSSRIVGYENPFRFDDKDFNHYRLSPLQLPEIEQFVNDWYRVRIENPKERKENVDDLVRILRDEAHTAIRELAQNPLLLTIIALVHRIDAVLPDERVVLYQKCTETLLNTWHTWKFRGTDTQRRGKIERRNRQRMEAIAYWMQSQARGNAEGQRAIVPAADLLRFLSEYIENNERVREEDDDPRDQAQDFLEFVKRRAGLLIEVGDQKYSFVHLTFQEYLTASHIATQSEKGGVDAIWATIGDRQSDPAWHEVIRLLIAALKADETQEFLVEKVLESTGYQKESSCARLLGGFLLDGIESAEDRTPEIGDCLFHAAVITKNIDELRPIVRTIHACALRSDKTRTDLWSAAQRLWKATTNENLHNALILTLLASGCHFREIVELTGGFGLKKSLTGWSISLFMDQGGQEISHDPPHAWGSFVALMQLASLTSPYLNLVASVSPAIALSIGFVEVSKMAFRLSVTSLIPGIDYGPFHHIMMHSCLVGAAAFEMSKKLGDGLARTLDRSRERHHARWDRSKALDEALNKALGRTTGRAHTQDRPQAQDRSHDQARTRARSRAQTLARFLPLTLERDPDPEQSRARGQDLERARNLANISGFWNEMATMIEFQQTLINMLCDCFKLQPRPHWGVALQTSFIFSVPERMILLNPDTWQHVWKAFEEDTFSEGDVYAAAWLLLLDSMLWITKVYMQPDDSFFRHLSTVTRKIDLPPLRFANCVRDLAYGDESRAEELNAMVKSDDPAYRQMFEECLWRPTQEELKRKKKKKRTMQPAM